MFASEVYLCSSLFISPKLCLVCGVTPTKGKKPRILKRAWFSYNDTQSRCQSRDTSQQYPSFKQGRTPYPRHNHNHKHWALRLNKLTAQRLL